MNLRLFIPIIALSLSNGTAVAENKTTAHEYIDEWSNEAIYQMVLHKVPASITLAQGMLESNYGNSRLATEGNNHFGIKCHKDWDGKKIYEDDETEGECFRKYKNVRDSFEDHSLFLKRTRYESLFKLNTDDYKGWAKGLKECGYATNPKYPQQLIKIIEEHNLTRFDQEGMKLIKQNSVPTKSNDKKKKDKKNTATAAPPFPSDSEKDFNDVLVSARYDVKLSDNRIKYVLAKAGDTPLGIATDMEMMLWQIEKYNDINSDEALADGQIIYLQPKRSRAAIDSYTTSTGDTWWSISQKYGIKLKKLKALNTASNSDEPTYGTVLKLK